MEKNTKTPRVATKRPKRNTTGNDKATFTAVALGKIELSPVNYRKSYDPHALEELAAAIRQQGIISPLTLRPLKDGRYELVAGERRYRAALLAGLKEVPALIRPLTDESVTEIQLAENLQREDPHPLHEAQAVSILQRAGKSISEIAARLGKSKAFVYSRIKLAGLIEGLQQVFLENKMTAQQAMELATLAPEAQESFLADYCTEWQEADFELPGLRFALQRYRYDLGHAPFATGDARLFPEAGACSKCPFNSATLKSLFPEVADEAICTNRDCYAVKCNRHLQGLLQKAAEQAPVAVIYASRWSEEMTGIIDGIPSLKSLPRYDRYHITLFHEPQPPEKEDYTYSWDTEEGQEDEFDEEGYQMALQEYEEATETYQQRIESGQAQRALDVSNGEVSVVYFSPHKKEVLSIQQVTAKEVQQTIKEGKATVELLEKEIQRITGREQRSKELDVEKVQANVHRRFTEQFSDRENNTIGLTSADQVAARLIVYQSLDYDMRRKVDQALFPENGMLSRDTFYETLLALTEDAYSYLIRMAVAGNAQSKYPNNITGWCLYPLAKEAGTDVAAIENEQELKAAARNLRVEARIKDLEGKIARLNWRSGSSDKS